MFLVWWGFLKGEVRLHGFLCEARHRRFSLVQQMFTEGLPGSRLPARGPTNILAVGEEEKSR